MTTNILFFFISRSLLLRMRNISNKSCRDNQNTHTVFSNFYFFENRAFYEKIWNNIVDRGRPQMTVWRMCIACWILKAASNTGCVILIAFLQQQWLHERA